MVVADDGSTDVQNPDIELAGKMADCNVEQAKRVYDPENLAPTISAGGGTGSIPKVDVSEDRIMWPSLNGSTEVEDGDGVIPSRPYSTRKSVMKDGVSFIVAATATPAVAEKTDAEEISGLRIRYLTPRECYRLMGQSEDAIDRILATEPTKTRQYKMAGNSIVVDVLVDIFRAIYIDKTFGKREKRPSLEDFL